MNEFPDSSPPQITTYWSEERGQYVASSTAAPNTTVMDPDERKAIYGMWLLLSRMVDD